MDLHDEIRRLAVDHHVVPALASRKNEFSIAGRDLMQEAEAQGISTVQRVPAFCKSIQTQRFLKQNGLAISRVEGPTSKLSTTVVVHYRIEDAKDDLRLARPRPETHAERAHRLTEKLRGLMKNQINSHGGAEGFIRWVRSDKDEG